MGKNDNVTDFMLDLSSIIRLKTKTTRKINPQDFSSKILGLGRKIYVNTSPGFNKFSWVLESKVWGFIPVPLFTSMIWTDGTNVYYSYSGNQYVLDVATSTWSPKTWNGLVSFYGSDVWTDGTNIYYSYDGNQYVLDVATSTWSPKTWNGPANVISSFRGSDVWTDGTNIYNTRYDLNDSTHRYTVILDVATSTWSPKTWGYTPSYLEGQSIWTDGTNIYWSYSTSSGSYNYVLDRDNGTWIRVYFSQGSSSDFNFDGRYVWTDGTNIYLIFTNRTYVLGKGSRRWDLLIAYQSGVSYDRVWTDGTNIYFSASNKHYILTKKQINYPFVRMKTYLG